MQCNLDLDAGCVVTYREERWKENLPSKVGTSILNPPMKMKCKYGRSLHERVHVENARKFELHC